MEMKQLKEQVSMAQLMEHGGSDRKLDLSEFIILKLQSMGRIQSEDIERATKVFRQMDVDGTGYIDATDLAQP